MSGSSQPRVVVLSDLHFGDDGALLTHDREVNQLFIELEALREPSENIDLLVLLGDIWDQWATDLSIAADRSSLFFRALADWNKAKRIILLAGNHDYHLKTFTAAKQRMQMLGWQPAPSLLYAAEEEIAVFKILPQGNTGETFNVNGLELEMYYPELRLEINGRKVLLTHGHHLDFFSRSFWWAKTGVLARLFRKPDKVKDFADIDRLNQPFFELLTNTARVPEVVHREYLVLNLLRILGSLLRFKTFIGGRSPRRYTEVEKNVKEAIELQKRLLGDYMPDLFVFGHTHHEGFADVEVDGRKFLLANSGCFFNEAGHTTVGTYLVIDDQAHLRYLGKPEDPENDVEDYPPPP